MLADRTPRTILGAPFMRLRMGGDVPPPSSRDDHQRPTVVLKGTAHGRNGFSRAINQPPRSGYRSAEGLPLGRLTHCRTNLAFSRTGGRPIRKFRSWQNRAPEPYVFPHMDSSRSYKRNPNLVILSEVARQASRAVEGPRETRSTSTARIFSAAEPTHRSAHPALRVSPRARRQVP